MTLKNTLTLEDKAEIIDTMIQFIIGKDENGDMFYHPYMKKTALEIAVYKHMIDGIELDEDDDLYTVITTDEDVINLFEKFKSTFYDEIEFIFKMVDDIVDFQKQIIIHNNSMLNDKLAEIFETYKTLEKLQLEIANKQNKILSQQLKANEYQEEVMNYMTPDETAELNKKLLSGEYDINKISEIVVQQYINSELHKSKEQEIIASQQDKIADLSKYKAIHDARNVLSKMESKD